MSLPIDAFTELFTREEFESNVCHNDIDCDDGEAFLSDGKNHSEIPFDFTEEDVTSSHVLFVAHNAIFFGNGL